MSLHKCAHCNAMIEGGLIQCEFCKQAGFGPIKTEYWCVTCGQLTRDEYLTHNASHHLYTRKMMDMRK